MAGCRVGGPVWPVRRVASLPVELNFGAESYPAYLEEVTTQIPPVRNDAFASFCAEVSGRVESRPGLARLVL